MSMPHATKNTIFDIRNLFLDHQNPPVLQEQTSATWKSNTQKQQLQVTGLLQITSKWDEAPNCLQKVESDIFNNNWFVANLLFVTHLRIFI